MIAGNIHRSEGSVLAYALFRWEPFGRELVQVLTADHFTDHFYVHIFQLMQECHQEDDPRAVLSFIHDRLSTEKDAQDATAALATLLGSHCGPGEATRGHFDWHLSQLRLSRARRDLSDLGASLVESLDSGELPIDKIRRECDEIEKALAAESSKVGIQSILDAIDANQQQRWISTGFAELDECINGMFPGEMIVLAACPGVGKTAFSLHTVMHNIRKQRSVLFASYEMDQTSLMFRLLSSQTQIPLSRFYHSHRMTADERSELALVANEVDSWPLHIFCPTKTTVAALEAYCAKLADKTPLSLVVVDYLQLLDGPGNTRSKYEEVSAVSKSIKHMARRLDVPVLTLCQLNREAAKEKPRKHHLRDSGQIEQDADVIMLLAQHEQHVRVLVDKARKGESGQHFDLTFDGRTQSWSEINRVNEFDEYNRGTTG